MSGRALWALLGTFALLALLYSVVVPPFETPDEIWHFAVIQQIATGGGLPISEPQTTALWRQQGAQAPGYYLAAAALTAWIDQSDFPELYQRSNPHAAIGVPDLLNRAFFLHYPADGWPWRGSILALHLARFFSIALAVTTLWATFQGLRLLLGQRQALLATALFAFVPQFLFISSAASNDNAINAVAALLLWRLAALLRALDPAAPLPGRAALLGRHYLPLGLLVGLGLLAKVSGLWLALLLLAALALASRRRRSWQPLIEGGTLALGLAALLAGWWFVRNQQLYGDPLANRIWLANILLRGEPLSVRAFLAESEGLHHSFWGLFGWFNIAYPTWLYRALQGLTLLVAVGLARRVAQGRWRVTGWRGAALALYALWPLLLALSWLGFMRIAPAGQGRYFHPAAPSLALALWAGLTVWTGARRPWLAWATVAALFALSVVTPAWKIRPAYERAPLVAALPAGALPLGIHFDEALVLEGYSVAASERTPSSPVDVTLFWRALRPIPERLSVGLKGYGRGGQLIALDDSFPDAGRWPTDSWPVGALVPDRRRFWLSGQTHTPTLGRITVEVYRRATLETLEPTRGGQPVPPPALLLELAVRAPGSSPAAPAPFAFRPAPQRLTLAEGQARLAFAWQVGQPLGGRYQAFFHLVSEPGIPPLEQQDFAPQGGDFPTDLWWPGDSLPDEARLTLPTTLEPGRFALLLGLYDPATGAKIVGEAGEASWVVGRLLWDGRAWSNADED